MLNLDADSVANALPYDQLISALDEAFRVGATVPDRTHLDVIGPERAEGTVLLMPCWQTGGNLGVKIATVFPGNAAMGMSAVYASYFLMDASTGEPIAVMDGTELTLRRTAAASALASRYLSRSDSSSLLMVGTGRLAPHLIAAHASARPIDNVLIWGRREEAANALKSKLSTAPYQVGVVTDLEVAVDRADIISCATLAREPLVKGDWLQEGQHLDLVGAFKADMRETDSIAVSRAEVFVDTVAGALSEAGDILQAIEERAIKRTDIKNDLEKLARGRCQGRTSSESITLFKSVGTALEDLAAGELAIRNHSAQ